MFGLMKQSDIKEREIVSLKEFETIQGELLELKSYLTYSVEILAELPAENKAVMARLDLDTDGLLSSLSTMTKDFDSLYESFMEKKPEEV